MDYDTHLYRDWCFTYARFLQNSPSRETDSTTEKTMPIIDIEPLIPVLRALAEGRTVQRRHRASPAEEGAWRDVDSMADLRTHEYRVKPEVTRWYFALYTLSEQDPVPKTTTTYNDLAKMHEEASHRGWWIIKEFVFEQRNR